MEVARLRAMQEKQADHQSEQDELRARRYQVRLLNCWPTLWVISEHDHLKPNQSAVCIVYSVVLQAQCVDSMLASAVA
jgi:hypothetical protein